MVLLHLSDIGGGGGGNKVGCIRKVETVFVLLAAFPSSM